jgi:hypothetical protein
MIVMDIFVFTFIKFCYTIGVVFLLARFLYYPNAGKKEYLFTYILLAAIIAELCIMISRVDMSFGFALGIFAIFSLIRYRTAPISPREMTYIFLSVGIAAKNQLVPEDIAFYKILVTDAALLLLAWLSEHFLFGTKERTKVIVYNNLELIRPEKKDELFAELKSKFGIDNIKTLKTGKIDVPKSTVKLLVTFKDTANTSFDDD